MWLAIVVIIVYVIVHFYFSWYQQNRKIAKEGGMLIKYNELIEFLMKGDTRSRIYKVTGDTVTLGVSSSAGGSTIFLVTQAFDNLLVEYRIDNPIYGKRKIEWKFKKEGNQNKMCEIINNDIGIAITKWMESKMF